MKLPVNMRKFFLSLFSVVSILVLTFVVSTTVQAAVDDLPQPSAFSKALFEDGYFIPPQCLDKAPVQGTQNTKACDINAVMTVVINVSRLILGTIGSVALLMFIYGGVTFMTSAGNTQRVEQGKTILINAVIGIAIVLFSWVFVNTLVAALTTGEVNNPRIFDDKAPL